MKVNVNGIVIQVNNRDTISYKTPSDEFIVEYHQKVKVESQGVSITGHVIHIDDEYFELECVGPFHGPVEIDIHELETIEEVAK